jgi:hypothetical protein
LGTSWEVIEDATSQALEKQVRTLTLLGCFVFSHIAVEIWPVSLKAKKFN